MRDANMYFLMKLAHIYTLYYFLLNTKFKKSVLMPVAFFIYLFCERRWHHYILN